MNTDRANFLLDGPNGAGTGVSAPARANALYTRGDVLAGGRLDLSGNAVIYGNISTLGNQYIAGNLSTIGSLSVGGTVNFKNDLVVGNAALTAGSVTVSTAAVTTNSKIYLTFTGFSGSTGFLRVGTIVNGVSFQIVSSNGGDTGTVNWLIIN
jgi:hypothetical protein